MKKRENFAPIFIFFLVLSFIVLGLIRINFFNNFFGVIGDLFFPVQKITYQSFQALFNLNENEKVKKLKEENLNLTLKLLNQRKLEADNQALRDQFQTTTIKTSNLIPAKIIGSPNFVPGVTNPSMFIIDKGTSDGIRLHQAVIYKDNLVGKISEVTKLRSKVNLITSSVSSFPARSLRSNAVGIVSGQAGRQVIFKNVVQEADIKEGDLIVTAGNETLEGKGFPPDLIVGKIMSVEKKPSALFQSANIESNLNFSNLTTVFVINQ